MERIGMESLPPSIINSPGRRQRNTARGVGVDSRQPHRVAPLTVGRDNRWHNTAPTSLSPLGHLDSPDKPHNGSLETREPTAVATSHGAPVAAHQLRGTSVNRTEIDLTAAINDSLDSEYANFAAAADEVASHSFQSPDFCSAEGSSPGPVDSGANSSTGKGRPVSSRLLPGDSEQPSGGSRLLKPPAEAVVRTEHRRSSPGGERGSLGGVLNHEERQTVRSLVSPPLVSHLSPGGDAAGNRRRSRSDVRYDALPVLDNGEIDTRSYRLAPSPVRRPKRDQQSHRLSGRKSPRDGTSHSGEKLYPLSEESEQEGRHRGLNLTPSPNRHRPGEAEHSARSTAEASRGHPPYCNAAARTQHRRNALAHIMDGYGERCAGADESFVRIRPRRDTCAINPAGVLALRFKQGVYGVPKRRARAYSDLSLADKAGGNQASAARRISINSQQRLVRAQLARQKFSHAIKMVIILLRIHSMVFQKRKHENNNKGSLTFTEIAEQFQSTEMKSSGLSFDPRDFKAKREINISTEAKNILNMPSYARTPEQLQTALYGLQTMKSFAEYPLHMQEKLVKVAWFECVPPKRVIIRQGHYAENFYFVISGSVVVTIMETKASTGEPHIRTAAVLRKGSSFGELALLHHSKRTATVSSQGAVQLLAIGREDFFDIFMRGQQPGEEPEHVNYLRQLHFMKHWPVERLIEHPEMCLFHFYKRGQVIVKDSNKSDWIYVVKSGSCQVLKQLDAVKPTQPHRPSTHSPTRLPRLHARQLSAPELPAKRPMRTRIRNHSATTSYLQFISVPTVSSVNMAMASDALHNLLESDPFEGALSLPDTFLTRQRTAAPSESNFSQVTFEDAASGLMSGLPRIDGRRGATPPRESFSRSKYRDFARRRNPQPPAGRMSIAPQVTVTDDHASSDSSSSAESRGSIFVQIELLLPKDVFGLSTLSVDLGIDHEQSSVNLVSRGAECIMIQKDFFAKHCTDEVKRHIRSLIKPYPPPDLLQHNLQNHSNWTNYKQEAVASILRDRSKARDLRL